MATVRPNSSEPSGTAGSAADTPPLRGSKPTPKSIWLNGDVLACACPDCGAPIAIRAWLMLGDCIRCGTSVELTEEQEREARRLLDQRARQTGKRSPQSTPVDVPEKKVEAAPAAKPKPTPAVEPVTLPVARAVPVPPAPPRRPLPQLVKPEPNYDWLQDLPAWLVSLIVHLVIMMLLGLWTVKSEEDRTIVLSAVYGSQRQEGEPGIYDPKVDEVVFEDPGKPPENETPKEAAARQEAEELRAPGDKNEPPRPKLGAIVAALTKPTDRRMFEGRDPRVRTTVLNREGGTTLTEAAVARGLRWLSKHQESNGSWGLDSFHRAGDCDGQCRGQGHHSDTGGTALALLPFLGAGQTHYHGRYSEVVKSGLGYLLLKQQPDGSLIGQGNGQMYAHGIATIVLCEAYALTGDKELRESAERAVNFIVRAQHGRGGWRYGPGQPGDTSVVGWQVMALHSATMAGFEVPEETFELAGRFLDDAAASGTDGALYAYQPGGAASPTMTAEGLLCREYLGWPKDHPGLQAGAQLLVRDFLPSRREPNIYMWYYATQVLHHLGGPDWERWNSAIRNTLLEMQETDGHEAGSWDPRGGVTTIGNHDMTAGGRIYMTSLAICTLEVYYRHLPIYRSIEVK